MAANNTSQSAGGGCLAVLALLIVVAMVVMAVISLAALIDPFDWMPSVEQIWEDCSGDCALAHRFPGFWWHAAANLLYAGLAVAVGGGFLAAVGERAREARRALRQRRGRRRVLGRARPVRRHGHGARRARRTSDARRDPLIRP